MADEIKSEALSENEAGQAAAATPQTVSANADAPQAKEPQADEQQAVSEKSSSQTPEAQADEPQTMADVEAELMDGSEEAVLLFAARLAREFALEVQPLSKHARAMLLIASP